MTGDENRLRLDMDSKKLQRVLRCILRDMVETLPSYLCDVFCDFFNITWLIAFAAIWDGRKIWRVRF